MECELFLGHDPRLMHWFMLGSTQEPARGIVDLAHIVRLINSRSRSDDMSPQQPVEHRCRSQGQEHLDGVLVKRSLLECPCKKSHVFLPNVLRPICWNKVCQCISHGLSSVKAINVVLLC